MNKERAPLYDALAAEQQRGFANFHVPGHKGGRGIDREAAPFFDKVMEIDYTEITGLDDLHHPDGVIREAQELAAECFGAEGTHFLVNGSTVGNLAMILSVCGRGDLILVQRNVHKSVLHGLMLAEARAVFLAPKWNETWGLAAAVGLDTIEEALAAYPEAKAVLLTNPNYYGMTADLRSIAETVHEKGMPLLIDEAHGAHYGFHPRLPASAMECGADAAVQSTHKMLSAMTMGAMLHLQGNRINREAVKRNLSILQSSSPSYPLLASLDLARRQMHVNGQELLEQGLRVVDRLRKRLETLGAFQVLEPGNGLALDPFKLTLRDGTGTYGGFELQRMVEERGCRTEMADLRHVLFHLSFASGEDEAERLFRALESVSAAIAQRKTDKGTDAAPSILLPEAVKSERVSAPVAMERASLTSGSGQTQRIPLKEAEGRRAAEMIIPYPPGIPMLYPGEIITPTVLETLLHLSEQGARFQGALDGRLATINVYL